MPRMGNPFKIYFLYFGCMLISHSFFAMLSHIFAATFNVERERGKVMNG